jgi:hypothetical protein
LYRYEAAGMVEVGIWGNGGCKWMGEERWGWIYRVSINVGERDGPRRSASTQCCNRISTGLMHIPIVPETGDWSSISTWSICKHNCAETGTLYPDVCQKSGSGELPIGIVVSAQRARNSWGDSPSREKIRLK